MEYKVKTGDSWHRIATNLGVDVNDLLKANNATLDTAIHPGQILKTSKSIGSGQYVKGLLQRGNTKSANPFIPAGYQAGVGARAGAVRSLQEETPQAKPKKSPSNLDKVLLATSAFTPFGTQAIISAVKDTKIPKQTIETAKQVASNMLRDPKQAMLDTELYLADQLGAPTNATNYLRDLVVNIPYRNKTAVHAGIKTLFGNKSYSENYQELFANPGFLTDATTIRPLTNTNSNFSEEELAAIRDMAADDFKITNSDIKRVSEDGKYGGTGYLTSYFTPTKVVQTAIGQSSGDPDSKTITDVFDVNTRSSEAKRDNEMYLNKAIKNPGLNYETLRATMPYFNSTDAMPDKYKIHTIIKYEE